jgi:hypothetical protein
MPNISLADIYERIEPWDFSIELERGKPLPVRRLSNEDVARINAMLKAPATSDSSRELLAEFFGDSVAAADVAAWDNAKVSMVLTAILTYYQEAVLKKKSVDVAALVRLQVTAAKAAGNA